MRVSQSSVELSPAMDRRGEPEWAGAVWIAAMDVCRLAEIDGGQMVAIDSSGYSRARILLRDGIDVLGFFDIAVTDCRIDSGELTRRASAALSRTRSSNEFRPTPPMTVAVSTRDRPENMPELISALLGLDYPEFDILIVDNASSTSGVVDYVEGLNDPRVRVVREGRPGVSRGRNRAMVEATYDIIAFTDDDAVVDPLWLLGLAQGFARAPDVALVTGMVPSGEMATPAQAYFERRISWEVAARSRVFRLTERPADIPLFPFEVGAYGTGANFAITRDLALRLHGMNEALGAGSPSGGGEDIDFFVRALYAGAAIAYEPSAVVWHRHRPESAELRSQMASYGRGMGAWIACVLLSRESRGDALRLLTRVARRLPAVGSADPGQPSAHPGATVNDRPLRRTEVRGMVAGPWCYFRSRREGRVTRPLTRG